MIQPKNTTGIILAGGKSSRMGEDKGFVKLNGTTFMHHIIDALKPLVGRIIIVSNNSNYDVFKVKRVVDIMEDSGPLAGIYSGLSHSETETNIVLSCDIPLIETIVLNKLISAYDSENDVFQIESDGKTMPLVALYKKSCLNHIQKRLEEGERRLQTVVAEMKTKTIVLEPRLQNMVRNINSKNDLIYIGDEGNN